MALTELQVTDLSAAIRVLAVWQRDAAAVQLHPGDLGWQWRFGATKTATALRTWSRDGRILALGMLDSPSLLRLAIAPEVRQDESLAAQMLLDVSRPEHRVLPVGDVCIEVRSGGRFRDLLKENGWQSGEMWTPLRRSLVSPVEDPGTQIDVVSPVRAPDRVAVHRGAFERSTFTEASWQEMAAGPCYSNAKCLIAVDDLGRSVAGVTVWSAGPGRPGLLEPMGVHRDHRRQGYGRAITLAAASALRDMGSSSAIVCTPSSNISAVATYRSAGFDESEQVPDLCRSS